MNAISPIPAVITGRHTLVRAINAARRHHGMSDQELLRRAGLSPNTLTHLRSKNQDVFVSTAVALLNELGHDLVAFPTGQRPVAPLVSVSPAVTKRLPELRRKLVDLRTSIANQRHTDDLKHEIDDLLFWLEKPGA